MLITAIIIGIIFAVVVIIVLVFYEAFTAVRKMGRHVDYLDED